MDNYCFVNGKIVAVNEAFVSVNDLGLQRSYGVFEYIRKYNSKFFRFSNHFERFVNSAGMLRLEIPYSETEIFELSDQLVNKSNLLNPAIKIILTGGVTDDYIFRKPGFIIIAEELRLYPSKLFEEGIKLLTMEFQRELPAVKSTNYMNEIRLTHLKIERGVADFLYTTNNKITECPRSNIFIFKNEKLITPQKDILPGITRQIVIELARNTYSVEEKVITKDELFAADEVFITSTSKGIMPVVKVDDHLIGNGNIGKNTKVLTNTFYEYTQSY